MNIDKSFSTLCTFGLLTDKSISSIDREIYLYVKFRYQFFKTLDDSFRESVETISKLFGYHQKTVRRSLKELVERGYLEAKLVPGKPTEYSLPLVEKWTDPRL